MPSKGRPQAKARIDECVLVAVKAQLALTREHANYHTLLDDEVSTFVERAVIEKLFKMKRSREGRKKAREPVSDSRAMCKAEETVQDTTVPPGTQPQSPPTPAEILREFFNSYRP